MDPYESNEGPTSITESSQEWHILNLLRVCERDLFETNLQEFRKIQLTESQDGKVRLCKLINEVLRLDPQYSIILIEDLSHLFNDSNPVVQKYALLSLVDTFNILFTHIIASNGLVVSLTTDGDYDSNRPKHMSRCKGYSDEYNSYTTNSYYSNHVHRHNTLKRPEMTDVEQEQYLPFSLDNPRVFESFSDLACVRFMVHTRLLEESFLDVKYKSVHSLPNLLYNRTRFFSVNLLKVLFYELSNYPNYLCSKCTSGTDDTMNRADVKSEKQNKNTKDKDNKSNKENKETKKDNKGRNKSVKGSKSREKQFDIYDTLYRWHDESVKLLKVLLSKNLKGVLEYENYRMNENQMVNKENEKDKQNNNNKNTKERQNKEKDNNKHNNQVYNQDVNNNKNTEYCDYNVSDGLLVGSVLTSEVACCLISFYPEFYFDDFVGLLVPFLSTRYSRVFETVLFRLFSSTDCYSYHHLLLDKVNQYGYNLDLKQVYQIVQTLPSRINEVYKGKMVVVEKVEMDYEGQKEKQFEITDQLVTNLNVEFDEKLSMYPAAQLFEFDKELVKKYKNIKKSQIKICNNFYKRKPVDLTTVQYPVMYFDENSNDNVSIDYNTSTTVGIDYTVTGTPDNTGYSSGNYGINTVSDSMITKNEKLFVRLMGCQMLDTVYSYQRFLRFEVIGPKLVNYDVFSKFVMNHFLLSNLVNFENRKEVLCNLLNYLSEYVLVNYGDMNLLFKTRRVDGNYYGLSGLFSYVNQSKDSEMFVKYLERLNELVLYSYSTNVAKSLVTNIKYKNNKEDNNNEHNNEYKRQDNENRTKEYDNENYKQEDNENNNNHNHMVLKKNKDYDYYMDLYEKFVNLSLTYVSKYISELDELGDYCVHTLSKFVLNLPKVPDGIADLIVLWVESNQQGNLKLAFSLVSNLLKLSGSMFTVDLSSTLGSYYYKYTSNFIFVRRSTFLVFLNCVTSKNELVSSLFLKLLSSPRGLYNNNYNYTLKSLERLHLEFVNELEQLKDNKDNRDNKKDKQDREKELYEDCLYLSDRPVWQWPYKLVRLVSESRKFKGFEKLSYNDNNENNSQDNEDSKHEYNRHEYDNMYYLYSNEEEEVNDDIGAWIEESVSLLSNTKSLRTSNFVKNAVETLLKLRREGKGEHDKDEEDNNKNKEEKENNNDMNMNNYNMDVDDSEVVYDDEHVNSLESKVKDQKEEELKYLYLEPMLSCCMKSSRLVFRLSELVDTFVGSKFYNRCSQTLSKYPRELELLIKYNDEYSPFIESLLEETRKGWCDVLFKFDERTSVEKNLMMLLNRKMEETPEYLIQMSPFLSPDELDKLMVFLFKKNEKEKMIKILDVIIETPKISLPQHFLYSTYNLPVPSAPSSDKERDYMKLQVSLLDTCIMYCTLGRFSVESAISSLYLIVESFDNINFVFGRLLCQFVQKLPLTRKVIVDVIFPKLIQKQCWQDKQLFKGVVITICTLWNHFKDQLLRYILEMPNSNVKMILKALQGQYNIAEYFKSINLPSNFKEILDDVLTSTPTTNK